ncbi:UDP-glycosyltransferase 89A2 [Ziziphus jujuba]|uniref:UDP-glycosyltransferase 89A2 n=1 Tax=Ziziphus jujuba TaxID=326968 RepID=A0A6P3YTJ5_ZIZJJ|nr:UDP-glycosyltransferase 89A2 [Ziziphus jujuba]
MSTGSNGKPHILVFPFPAQGHLPPLLDLTHQLSLKDLTITILITPKNLPSLTPLLSLHPNIQTLILPFPSHPKVPPGVENVKDLGNHGTVPVICAMANLQEPIIQWFESHPNPPVAILSDFFLGWTLQLAKRIKVPRFTFFSSGAFLSCILHYCWRNPGTYLGRPVVDFPDLPNSPSFREDNIPSTFRRYTESDPEMQIMRNGMIANTESSGVVFNSFDALEGVYFHHLRTRIGLPRVYGVGPLSLLGVAAHSSNRVNPNDNSGLGSETLGWLDGCPAGSVLYVCFGSQKLLNRQQMEALASGLEQSRTRFVWVVKTGTEQQVKDGYGAVPDGFEERVGGRGLVIRTWAPQVPILSHRAVGVFLSHCGWNSTLEGIVAGVMILAWPMEADQFVDAMLLVEDMGVAVKVCEGADGVPDSAELAKAIAESMSLDAPQKVKAKELKEKALEAVKEGGSSLKDLDKFVKELEQLIVT